MAKWVSSAELHWESETRIKRKSLTIAPSIYASTQTSVSPPRNNNCVESCATQPPVQVAPGPRRINKLVEGARRRDELCEVGPNFTHLNPELVNSHRSPALVIVPPHAGSLPVRKRPLPGSFERKPISRRYVPIKIAPAMHALCCCPSSSNSPRAGLGDTDDLKAQKLLLAKND